MKLDLYTSLGEKKGTVSVSSEVFDAPFNEALVHQALVRQHANRRTPIAKTKTKGEVRGGGRKPFKQKGTGRARAGSNRSPIWKGGGVTFGPTGVQNYSMDMPKKQRKLAICSALSEKVREKQVIVLDDYKQKEIKTKTFVEMISKLPVERSVLFVMPEANDIIYKSASNIPNLRVINAEYLNIIDLLKYRYIVFLKDATKKAEEIFSK